MQEEKAQMDTTLNDEEVLRLSEDDDKALNEHFSGEDEDGDKQAATCRALALCPARTKKGRNAKVVAFNKRRLGIYSVAELLYEVSESGDSPEFLLAASILEDALRSIDA
jgi:hypothetical protein